MHDEVLRGLRFEHGAPPANTSNERRTWLVVGITAVMMVAEIGVGLASGSKALEADGWHMGSHAGAIGLAGLAYWFARTRASAVRFSFGTGKVYALAGWTNAILLMLAAAWMMVESILRLVSPVEIHFEQALPVAVVGLIVNVVCAFLLHPTESAETEKPGAAPHGHSHHGHGHSHHGHSHHGHGHSHHGHSHENHEHGKDLNLQSAYLHVMLDLMTSVAAILALIAGRWWNLAILDPIMGLVGALLIVRWGVGLLLESASQLLDLAPADESMQKIRGRLEAIDDVKIADLHVWDLGFGRKACMASLVTHSPRDPETYRKAVLEVVNIDHLTVEVHPCRAQCAP